MRLQPVQRSMGELREHLLSEKTGPVGAFKLALGEAVHYWQLTYLPLHFREGANFRRYVGAGYTTKYSIKAERSKMVGGKGKKSLQDFEKATGISVYSIKMLKQFQQGKPIDNSPGVFSGATKQGMVNPANFKVKGTSKEMRGSWNSVLINWQALSAGRGSLGGGKLADYILYVTGPEWAKLASLIERKYWPYYCKLAGQGGGAKSLPSLSELPILAKAN